MKDVTLMTLRSGNVIQVSPLQKKARITHSLSHRQLPISVSNLLSPPLYPHNKKVTRRSVKLMQIPDASPEEAVSIFRQVNGDAAKKASPNVRYQVVK